MQAGNESSNLPPKSQSPYKRGKGHHNQDGTERGVHSAVLWVHVRGQNLDFWKKLIPFQTAQTRGQNACASHCTGKSSNRTSRFGYFWKSEGESSGPRFSTSHALMLFFRTETKLKCEPLNLWACRGNVHLSCTPIGQYLKRTLNLIISHQSNRSGSRGLHRCQHHYHLHHGHHHHSPVRLKSQRTLQILHKITTAVLVCVPSCYSLDWLMEYPEYSAVTRGQGTAWRKMYVVSVKRKYGGL